MRGSSAVTDGRIGASPPVPIVTRLSAAFPHILLASVATAGLTTALAQADWRLGAALAVLAALAVPSALQLTGAQGLVARACLLATAAVPFAPVAGLVAIGALASVALMLRPPAEDDHTLADLERHLAWSRRRDASADVVVLTVPATGGLDPAAIRDCFRYTDSVYVEERPEGVTALAVVDSQDLSREGLERRISAMVGPARFGWARFPDDGVTLETLRAVARDNLAGVSTARAPRGLTGAEVVL